MNLLVQIFLYFWEKCGWFGLDIGKAGWIDVVCLKFVNCFIVWCGVGLNLVYVVGMGGLRLPWEFWVVLVATR